MNTQINAITGSLKVSEEADKMRAEIKVVANFAWQHLKAAVLFRNQVRSLEQIHQGEPLGPFYEDVRSYASGCIMSATAGLEALINELFIAPHFGLRAKMIDFDKEFWGREGLEREKILSKYETALRMLNLGGLEKGKVEYQNAKALIGLRNSLVHFKPTWDAERQQGLVETLRPKFRVSPFVTPYDDFITMQCMGAGCCDWVVRSVFAFLYEFDSIAQLDPEKMRGFWLLEKTAR